MPSVCTSPFCRVRDWLSQGVLKTHSKTRSWVGFSWRDVLHIDGGVVLMGDLHHDRQAQARAINLRP